jgi:hypothetical protein
MRGAAGEIALEDVADRRLGVLPLSAAAPLFKFVVAIVGGAGVGSVTASA